VDDSFSSLDVRQRGRHVTIEPLDPSHVTGLAEAARGDRSTYTYTRVPQGVEETRAYVEELLEERRRGETIPCTLMSTGGDIVGITRYMNLRWFFHRDAPDVLEVGGTWLAPSAQRTAINTEAKLLVIGHAFDSLGVERVELKTDARNTRSRDAMARIGLAYEGTLASSHPSLVIGEEGQMRDSAFFGVTRATWPAVRDRLRSLLGLVD
jgi:N-acetyltransferase